MTKQHTKLLRRVRFKSKLMKIRYHLLALSLILVLFLVKIPYVLAQTPTLQSNQISTEVQQLVHQGKEAYNSSSYSLAVKLLQQALQLAKTRNGDRTQAVIHSNLSLAYQQLGDWDAAQQHISASLQLLQPSQSQADSPTLLKIYAQSLDIQSRLWYLHGKPEAALKSLQQAASIYIRLGDEAGSISSIINQAQSQQALGLYEQAYNNLEQIQQRLMALPDSAIKVQGYLSLGNVLLAIGEFKQSQTALQNSLVLAENLPSSSTKTEVKSAALVSLANMFWAKGNLERDRYTTRNYNDIPWQCQQLSRSDSVALASPRVGLSLPNTALKLYQNVALQYQQVLAIPSSPSIRVQTQINYLRLLVETGQLSAAQALWHEIKLSDLPNGRQAVYAKINAAQNLACISQKSATDSSISHEIDNLLESAIQDAKQLRDSRALSYALGNRGGFYEYLAVAALHKSPQKSISKADLDYSSQIQSDLTHNPLPYKGRRLISKPLSCKERGFTYLATSQKLTQQALLLTQPITAPDIAYQWEWQMGRILAAQAKNDQAIAFYQIAVESLKSVRSDLLTINSDMQFSYRDRVEPVYRGLVDLLLKNNIKSAASQEHLQQAIANIDALQLAELQNFLRCNLVQILPINREINPVDRNAVFIYPIILENRLEVIFKLPGQHLEHHVNSIPRTELQDTVSQLRSAIYTRNPSKIRAKSQNIYRWLIKPIEPYLQEHNNIKTLVFVLDGELRNIPMGVLYDEEKEQYLIQKDYALALLPNSQLFDLNNSQLKKPNILAGGVGEQQENIENHNFSSLNIDELQQIAKILPSKLLINSQFTPTNLHKQLQSKAFSILHFVTHGNFSSDPEDTYLLAYQQLIKARELNNLLRDDTVNSREIKLLVLSACKTAEGDNRAILGLAGLAVRAGANSTLSTLWQINDSSTSQLMVQFYTELKKGGVTKAEALHRAQKALLLQPEYQNPYYWAPYILVGNWQ
ncbi:CHAT domain-containing protein [Nostoc sp. C052]|uniref:CHAT domain-containing protein n=1 Tax=Nostoc sp. C052 TaxID=2576902 RepID=UPI0015C3041E|nr:CHAT domain-containing protein [Nostoc sp. C052]